MDLNHFKCKRILLSIVDFPAFSTLSHWGHPAESHEEYIKEHGINVLQPKVLLSTFVMELLAHQRIKDVCLRGALIVTSTAEGYTKSKVLVERTERSF